MKKDSAYGFHALETLINTAPQRIQHVYLLKNRQDQRAQDMHALLQEKNLPATWQSKEQLDALCEGPHQGVYAELYPSKAYTEQDLYALIKRAESDPLILVLDGVTDPHNLGACMRTADAAGVLAIVVPKDNSAGITDVTRKVASGAADTVPLIHVTNLARSLKRMQELGVWISGTAGEAKVSHFQADLRGPRAIVMGAEGKGMRRLTREHCDELIKIPMQGAVSSLNVSVATGVVLFEVLRQRG